MTSINLNLEQHKSIQTTLSNQLQQAESNIQSNNKRLEHQNVQLSTAGRKLTKYKSKLADKCREAKAAKASVSAITTARGQLEQDMIINNQALLQAKKTSAGQETQIQ